MIDLVYKTVTTIINKENNGYVTPTEFNLLCNKVQTEIFEEYFDNINRDENRKNRGLVNSGYGDLDFKQRQKITQLRSTVSIDKIGDVFTLPIDWIYIEKDEIITSKGKVVTECKTGSMGYLNNSGAKPSEIFPVYENFGGVLEIYPSTIDKIKIKYLRKPKMPNWTYVVVNKKEMFDPSNLSYQDFELHPSEFGNIVLRILSYQSINLREEEVTRIAESLKEQKKSNENN